MDSQPPHTPPCGKVEADILLLIVHGLASPGKDRFCKEIDFNIACYLKKIMISCGSVKGREGCQPNFRGGPGKVCWKL